MDVSDFFPKTIPEELKQPTAEAWLQIIKRRKSVYARYCELEGKQGFLQASYSAALPSGQEMIRILWARFLEECLEARFAESEMHFKEEIIDAFNYALSLVTLDDSGGPQQLNNLALTCAEAWRSIQGEWDRANLLRADSPKVFWDLLDVSSLMLEKLKNRAWQNRAHSTYFDGNPQMAGFLFSTIRILLVAFSCWEDFIEYFLAKEGVLIFRLESRY